jgi:hypothetical protein
MTLWPFSRRDRRTSNSPGRRPGFRPKFEALEDRTVPSTVTVEVPVNAQVLAYAQAHEGLIVGNGQCAVLAQDAVASAGGVPLTSLGSTGATANYVWGNKVATLTPTSGNTAAILPGDILQFSNVTETIKTVTTYSNGAYSWSSYTETAGHHTAIVSSVGGSSPNDVQVLQANVYTYAGEPLSQEYKVQGGTYWGGSSTVTTAHPGYTVTVTQTMTAGTISVYQPFKYVTEYLAANTATSPVNKS